TGLPCRRSFHHTRSLQHDIPDASFSPPEHKPFHKRIRFYVFPATYRNTPQSNGGIRPPSEKSVPLPLPVRGMYPYLRVLQTLCILPRPDPSLFRFLARTATPRSVPDSNQYSRTVMRKYGSVSAIRLLFRKKEFPPDPDTGGTVSPASATLRCAPAASSPDAHRLPAG